MVGSGMWWPPGRVEVSDGEIFYDNAGIHCVELVLQNPQAVFLHLEASHHP